MPSHLGGMIVATTLLPTAPGGIVQTGVFTVQATAAGRARHRVLRVACMIALMSFGQRLLGGRG